MAFCLFPWLHLVSVFFLTRLPLINSTAFEFLCSLWEKAASPWFNNPHCGVRVSNF
ncbi:unnamed protein product, partial [Larinioides sclopetarius]